MGFSPRFLDELRARVDLAEVVGRRVRLIKKGHEYVGLSPFQNEKSPSFTVAPDKGFYHCFSSGEHGDVIDFVMKTENLPFPEAVERLAAEAGMEMERQDDSPEQRQQRSRADGLYDVMEAAAQHFERALRLPEGKAALDYLRGRGLDDALIGRHRLGFAADSRGALKGALSRLRISEEQMAEAGLVIRPEAGRETYDRFRGRVMFPITDKRGRVIAFGGRILGVGEPKYLNSPETPLFHKGRVLYGLHRAAPAARKKGRLLVAEGYMDVIGLDRAGITEAVAPLGTALTEDQMRELWRIVPEPVLCFDGDRAGQKAARRAAERALALIRAGQGLRFALMPEGEDPDSLGARGGAAAIEQVLGGALSLSDVLWRGEAGERPPTRPEDRAALQKRLDDHVRRIEDPTLRTHFQQSFRDRLWALRTPARAGKAGKRPGTRFGTPAGTPSGAIDAGAAKAARMPPLLGESRVLMAALLNNPSLYDAVEEDIGSITLPDAALDGLRQAAIEVLAEGEIAPGPLRQRLAAQSCGAALERLLADPLVRSHRLIGENADPGPLRELWEEGMEAFRAAASRAEIEARRALPEETISVETAGETAAISRAGLEARPK